MTILEKKKNKFSIFFIHQSKYPSKFQKAYPAMMVLRAQTSSSRACGDGRSELQGQDDERKVRTGPPWRGSPASPRPGEEGSLRAAMEESEAGCRRVVVEEEVLKLHSAYLLS
ncbi:hypothetical protein SEVIR_6G105551v4 [Setaria viridis]